MSLMNTDGNQHKDNDNTSGSFMLRHFVGLRLRVVNTELS